MQTTIQRWSAALLLSLCAFFFTAVPVLAQSAAANLTGAVTDAKGGVLPGATISVKTPAGVTVRTAKTDAQGRFSLDELVPARYTVLVTAPGFGLDSRAVQLAAGQDQNITVALTVGADTQQVTVEANSVGSIASALAPMDALLEARSARTEITQAFIQNFTSPLADYGEAVEMAPGTFTTNGNGVGLGQSKTYFRGFPDGDYDIDFDGIPFYDTNSPTHHSWAFFPSQWLGGIDFDRSPGTASTIGPTPFGGSIHLLSRDLSPVQNIRGGVSYGSWHTILVDGQYDSGYLLPNKKLSMFLDVHHMSSDGYQTYNYQNRNAGSIKVQYKFSPTTTLTGFSGVVYLHANTPSFSSTRCQMYGTSPTGAYSCVSSKTDPTLLPYTGAGVNFYLADNSDPINYLDYQYNRYQVPTDFEYVALKTRLPFKIDLDVKPYTYDYDNAELYTNAAPITESTTVPYNGNPASPLWYGIKVQPCNVQVAGVLPCGVDKYNSYRKYGETLVASQTSKIGTIRAGLWYEWARTSRHQFPSDPLNNWQDQALSNFNEFFWTNSYQPYVEYEAHPLKKLIVTLGTKYAYYTINTKQYADDGATIGNLGTGATVGTGNPNAFVTNSGSYKAWLPSIDGNYRILNNWSAYAQLSTGSIVPPSNVFDFVPGTEGAATSTLPKQQRSTTYQGGTVLKLKRVTLDLDAYHIKFQNSYSSTTDPTTGEQDFYPQPASITKGIEGESNLYFGHGLSAYLNATAGKADYIGGITIYPTAQKATSTANPLWVVTPAGLWVQQTPSNTETEGLTYQNKGFDVGFFNKRVGQMYLDSGAYHNQYTVNPFSVTNMYLNYTIRSGGHFDQTKIRLSFNNILDEHNITSISPGTKATKLPAGTQGATQALAGYPTYTDPFNTVGGSAPVLGADTISALPGRSVVLSVTFGFSPQR